MTHRRFAAGLVAVAAAAAISACGSSASSTPASNGIASESPTAIVTAVTHAMRHVHSVHISGFVTGQSGATSGMRIGMNLDLVTGKGGRGTMTFDNLPVNLLASGKFVYMKSGTRFWTRFGNAAAAALVAGRWIRFPETGSLASFAKLVNLTTLFTQAHVDPGTVKGGTTRIDGQPVLVLRNKSKDTKAYIATTGSPVLVGFSESTPQHGSVVFDHYNAPVSLAPPANAVPLPGLS
jgi:hypothetical protein